MVYHQELLEIKMAGIPEVIKKLEPLGRSQKLNMDKIFDVFDALYDMSSEIYGSLGSNDCRSSSISKKDKLIVRNKIYKCIENFYNYNDKSDNFLLMLGFSINLYYIIGMYSVFGKFNINAILHLIEEENVRNYAKLINEFLHSKIKNGLGSLNLELEKNWTELRKKELYRGIKPTDRIYVPEIYMLGKESQFREDSDKYLNKMIEDYPDFKFGWIYYCLEKGMHFYKTKGKNAEELYGCKEKVGTQLFWYIIGVERYPYGTAEGHGRKIFRDNFGIGIPRIETINKKEYGQKIKDAACKKLWSSVKYKIENIVDNITENICILVNKDKYKKVRDNIKFMLCIDIPISTDKDSLKYTMTLFETVERQKKELENKNRKLRRNAEQKKEMMDYYAHSWKHISYPQIVKEVAEELGKTNRIVANRLMKAYNSERTLQRGIQLLQYISSDDERKVSIEFRKGIAKSGSDAPDFLNIFRVICDSLDLVIFKILMVESDDSTSIKKCREKWELRNSLNKLREEYTTLFLEEKENNCNIFEWTRTNLIDLKLDISNEWKDVRFKEDSFAINQFKEILVEMFTNIFIHGEVYAKMSFSANENEMIISETNKCTDTNPGSQSGISTMRKVLEYLNVGTNIQSLDIKLEEEYTLIIKLNKKLLIRRGR